jgi:hypothetical protein
MHGLSTPTRNMRGIPNRPRCTLVVYLDETVVEKRTTDIGIVEGLPFPSRLISGLGFCWRAVNN